jgi:hypothetical protein
MLNADRLGPAPARSGAARPGGGPGPGPAQAEGGCWPAGAGPGSRLSAAVWAEAAARAERSLF